MMWRKRFVRYERAHAGKDVRTRSMPAYKYRTRCFLRKDVKLGDVCISMAILLQLLIALFESGLIRPVSFQTLSL